MFTTETAELNSLMNMNCCRSEARLSDEEPTTNDYPFIIYFVVAVVGAIIGCVSVQLYFTCDVIHCRRLNQDERNARYKLCHGGRVLKWATCRGTVDPETASRSASGIELDPVAQDPDQHAHNTENRSRCSYYSCASLNPLENEEVSHLPDFLVLPTARTDKETQTEETEELSSAIHMLNEMLRAALLRQTEGEEILSPRDITPAFVASLLNSNVKETESPTEDETQKEESTEEEIKPADMSFSSSYLESLIDETTPLNEENEEVKESAEEEPSPTSPLLDSEEQTTTV